MVTIVVVVNLVKVIINFSQCAYLSNTFITVLLHILRSLYPSSFDTEVTLLLHDSYQLSDYN